MAKWKKRVVRTPVRGLVRFKFSVRRCGIPRRFDETLDRALFRSELEDHFALNWELADIELRRGHLGCAAEILESTRRWFHAHAAEYAGETGDRRYFRIAKRLYRVLLFRAQHAGWKEDRK